ncbi:lasso peptide biosynthesis PqqD family chaperone [Streptomyces botrytidirepellens]|uniref:Lasso peptide biosynthesis PqqD family chaperone n=1 Tax=Streptomyces botrytidirepellens TaxID=2486417 RepID=A0A3M8SVN3_9ACTN|nr:lasso peptide biosynthesis PqqD family chaperone [Streptomyces botrytidirepellens]RNF82772.1 lasso peptide biosynthesis PqqD family chaperone [Streptomyces botrytidirepellens]
MPLSLNPDVAVAETEDGAILLHQHTGRYWQLNVTGMLVLRRLLKGCTHGEVASDLVTRHGADPGQAQRDVTSLIIQLRAAKLLEEPR